MDRGGGERVHAPIQELGPEEDQPDEQRDPQRPRGQHGGQPGAHDGAGYATGDEPEEERRQACFHVMVSQRYPYPVAIQTKASDPTEAAPAAPVLPLAPQ